MEFNFRPDREAHLRMLCKEMGRSVDDFVNEAVLTFMEDYEDGRDAKATIAEQRANGEPMLSLEEVMRNYGLEGADLAESGAAAGALGKNNTGSDSELPSQQTHRAA